LIVLDLPGTYSLSVASADEAVTRDALFGTHLGAPPVDGIVAVLDATRLRLGLSLVLELRALGRPLWVALNQIDLARARGIEIDRAALEAELDAPVIPTVAVRGEGIEALRAALCSAPERRARPTPCAVQGRLAPWPDAHSRHAEVERILARVLRHEGRAPVWQARLDALVLHPLLGSMLLLLVLALVFQAVYAGAEPFSAGIEGALAGLGEVALARMPAGPLRSLLLDGILAGVGAVLVFLPQILILFAFILLLEDSGYLPRAAYLLDRAMRGLGLSGRAFIPLLSSFACAVPGIMATRTIGDPRERALTILLAPLMTCSARLPVYTLVIAAVIPKQRLWGGIELQALVLLGLYVAGIASAAAIAWSIRLRRAERHEYPLLLELPDYRWPDPRQLAAGLIERAKIFLARVGGVILALMVLLWALGNIPAPPPGASEPAIYHSVVGWIGRVLSALFWPLGFDWQIGVALVPGLAAREVAIAALGTVYALSGEVEGGLKAIIAEQWGLPTALAFLAWYVYAPQCLSTLVVARRELNSTWATVRLAALLFALAYAAALVTFQASRWLLEGM
jgi:ferrous iron transport protein B